MGCKFLQSNEPLFFMYAKEDKAHDVLLLLIN